MAGMVPLDPLCCQHSDGPDPGLRGGGNLDFRGGSGKTRRLRRVYSRTGTRSFSARTGTVLEQARLPDGKVLALLKQLREGGGTRATGRRVCYATVRTRREKGRVVEVVRTLVFGTRFLLRGLRRRSTASPTIHPSFVERTNGTDRHPNAWKRGKT